MCAPHTFSETEAQRAQFISMDMREAHMYAPYLTPGRERAVSRGLGHRSASAVLRVPNPKRTKHG
jgi:hypothetical protein